MPASDCRISRDVPYGRTVLGQQSKTRFEDLRTRGTERVSFAACEVWFAQIEVSQLYVLSRLSAVLR